MHPEELEELIQRLRPEGGTPHFSICDARTPDAYVRANREGLQLFARELLKASIVLDYSRNGEPVPFSRFALPEGGEVRLTHVRPFNGSELELPEPVTEPDLRSRLSRWAVWLGALVVLASTLIGFYTLVRWLFLECFYSA